MPKIILIMINKKYVPSAGYKYLSLNEIRYSINLERPMKLIKNADI